jgi:hypothetical protein
LAIQSYVDILEGKDDGFEVIEVEVTDDEESNEAEGNDQGGPGVRGGGGGSITNFLT